MNRIRPDVDVIMDLLHAVLSAKPDSTFTRSLLQQYQERGGLSKKQLQGLYHKASGVGGVPVSKLATLEAIILRRPTRYNSSPRQGKVEGITINAHLGEQISLILAKYPQHKRVLFLKSKVDHHELLSATEVAEITRIGKLISG